jgi:1-deoxy-D-xylulose-5-phosphate reductoisomerase
VNSARRVILLGSTGSIGTSTLEVLEHLRAVGEPIELVALAAGSRAAMALDQAKRFGVRDVALASEESVAAPAGMRLERGAGAASRLVERVARPGDIVVGAIVGAAGLPAILTAIERGCTIALANKETLVAAGSLVMPLARSRGVAILPVDSEHSAIAQCLRSGETPREVRRLVITASGGPFRAWSAERMRQASPAEALRHPTWTMGPKVTIDSASLMNKALEMIEAFWLFGVPAERIEPLIHPQSIVHSVVEFSDGSSIAQLSAPDMKLPIQCALTWPRRLDGCSPRLDWSQLRSLEFEPVDESRWRAPALARRVMTEGGTAGAILNAANEVAVEAFLAGRVPFGRIVELVEEVMDAIPVAPLRSLDDVSCADELARARGREIAG